MLNFFLSILPTLILLGVLIFVHELGHFLAARRAGVRVEKFSIGFGPELIRWQRKGTRYALSLIPLGGFVKLAGEALEGMELKDLKPDDYLAQSVGKRTSIILAGPVMNYLLALLLFVFVYWVGRPLPASVIGGFVQGFPAATSGLQVGDWILQINGKPIRHWADVTETIAFNPSDQVVVTVQRNAEEHTYTIDALEKQGVNALGERRKVRRIGILPDEHQTVVYRYPFPRAVWEGIKTCGHLTILVLKTMWKLVTLQLSLKALSGPVGIFVVAGKTAKFGLMSLIDLAAFLSVSLALFNLLPIPALDGGHLLFLGIEAVRRRPVSFRIQEGLTQIGFVFLILLMMVVMWNDFATYGVLEKLRKLL